MRLSPDAYDRIKKLRHDVPVVSPAATRVADYRREPAPSVDSCMHSPPEAAGPCTPTKEEDVSFTCPRVEPGLPCCNADKRG